MTGPSHYVGGVELAIAELQEPLWVNERSDKTSPSTSLERKWEFPAVRTLPSFADLTAAFVASAVAIVAAADLTFTGSHKDKSPARHHSRRAIRNSSRHHHHHEAVTHAQYAHARGCVKPSA